MLSDLFKPAAPSPLLASAQFSDSASVSRSPSPDIMSLRQTTLLSRQQERHDATAGWQNASPPPQSVPSHSPVPPTRRFDHAWEAGGPVKFYDSTVDGKPQHGRTAIGQGSSTLPDNFSQRMQRPATNLISGEPVPPSHHKPFREYYPKELGICSHKDYLKLEPKKLDDIVSWQPLSRSRSVDLLKPAPTTHATVTLISDHKTFLKCEKRAKTEDLISWEQLPSRFKPKIVRSSNFDILSNESLPDKVKETHFGAVQV